MKRLILFFSFSFLCTYAAEEIEMFCRSHRMLSMLIREGNSAIQGGDQSNRGLLLVSDSEEGEMMRLQYMLCSNYFSDLKEFQYRNYSLIGVITASPFLKNAEKSSLLKISHQLGIKATQKDKQLESDFVFKRNPRFFQLLLCIRKQKLPKPPPDILYEILAYIKS